MASSTPDYQKMQRDAEQRLKDMQHRANRAVHSHDMPPVPNFVKLNQSQQARQNNQSNGQNPRNVQSGSNNGRRQGSPMPQNEPPKEPPKEPPEQKGGIFSRFKGLNILKALNFQNIHIDNDVLIIVALIFLLSGEDTDELLLLALVYIML